MMDKSLKLQKFESEKRSKSHMIEITNDQNQIRLKSHMFVSTNDQNAINSKSYYEISCIFKLFRFMYIFCEAIHRLFKLIKFYFSS